MADDISIVIKQLIDQNSLKKSETDINTLITNLEKKQINIKVDIDNKQLENLTKVFTEIQNKLNGLNANGFNSSVKDTASGVDGISKSAEQMNDRLKNAVKTIDNAKTGIKNIETTTKTALDDITTRTEKTFKTIKGDIETVSDVKITVDTTDFEKAKKATEKYKTELSKSIQSNISNNEQYLYTPTKTVDGRTRMDESKNLQDYKTLLEMINQEKTMTKESSEEYKKQIQEIQEKVNTEKIYQQFQEKVLEAQNQEVNKQKELNKQLTIFKEEQAKRIDDTYGQNSKNADLIDENIYKEILKYKEEISSTTIENMQDKEYLSLLKSAENDIRQMISDKQQSLKIDQETIKVQEKITQEKQKQEKFLNSLGKNITPSGFSLSASKTSPEDMKNLVKSVGGLNAEIKKIDVQPLEKSGNTVREVTYRVKEGKDKWHEYKLAVVESGQDGEKSLRQLDLGSKDVITRQVGLLGRLKNAWVAVFAFSGVTGAYYELVHQIESGVSLVNTLNKSMTNIQMITGQSSTQIQGLTNDYSNLATELHTTTAEMMSGAEEFLRAGHNAQETRNLLKASTIGSAISGQDNATTSEQLIAISNGYKLRTDNAKELMGVIDKLSTVDNASATSFKELATAMQYTSASAQGVGVKLPDLVSYIGTVSSVSRRSAESIGQSFKTIFSRYESIAANKKVDGTGQAINDVDKTLQNIGINIRKDQTHFKDFNVVLDELSKKWSTLNDLQKSQTVGALAGTRQRENLLILLNNMNQVKSLQDAMTQSTGSAEKKFDEAYGKSTEAKINDLKHSIEMFWQKAVNSNEINTVISGLNGVVKAISFVSNNSVAKTAIITASLGLLFQHINAGSETFKKLYVGDFNGFKKSAEDSLTSVGDSIKSFFGIASSSQKESMANMAKGMIDEQANQILKEKENITNRYKASAIASGEAISEEAIQQKVANEISENSVLQKNYLIMAEKNLRASAIASGEAVTQEAIQAEATNLAMKDLSASTFLAGGALKSLMISTGIGLAITLGIDGITKLVGWISNLGEAEKKLQEQQDKFLSNYKNNTDQVEKLKTKYTELNETTNRSTEQNKQFRDVQNELVKVLPTVSHWVDAEGNSHIANANAIDKELVAYKNLHQAKLSEDADKAEKNIQKLQASNKPLQEQKLKLEYVIGVKNNLSDDKLEAIKNKGIKEFGDFNVPLSEYSNSMNELLSSYSVLNGQIKSHTEQMKNNIPAILESIPAYQQMTKAQQGLTIQLADAGKSRSITGITNEAIKFKDAFDKFDIDKKMTAYNNAMKNITTVDGLKTAEKALDNYKGSLKDLIDSIGDKSLKSKLKDILPDNINKVSVGINIVPNLDGFSTFKTQYNKLLNDYNNDLNEAQRKTKFDIAKTAWTNYVNSVYKQLKPLGYSLDDVKKILNSIPGVKSIKFETNIDRINEQLANLKITQDGITSAFDKSKDKIEALQGALNEYNTETGITQSTITNLVSLFPTLADKVKGTAGNYTLSKDAVVALMNAQDKQVQTAITGNDLDFKSNMDLLKTKLIQYQDELSGFQDKEKGKQKALHETVEYEKLLNQDNKTKQLRSNMGMDENDKVVDLKKYDAYTTKNPGANTRLKTYEKYYNEALKNYQKIAKNEDKSDKIWDDAINKYKNGIKGIQDKMSSITTAQKYVDIMKNSKDTSSTDNTTPSDADFGTAKEDNKKEAKTLQDKVKTQIATMQQAVTDALNKGDIKTASANENKLINYLLGSAPQTLKEQTNSNLKTMQIYYNKLHALTGQSVAKLKSMMKNGTLDDYINDTMTTNAKKLTGKKYTTAKTNQKQASTIYNTMQNIMNTPDINKALMESMKKQASALKSGGFTSIFKTYASNFKQGLDNALADVTTGYGKKNYNLEQLENMQQNLGDTDYKGQMAIANAKDKIYQKQLTSLNAKEKSINSLIAWVKTHNKELKGQSKNILASLDSTLSTVQVDKTQVSANKKKNVSEKDDINDNIINDKIITPNANKSDKISQNIDNLKNQLSYLQSQDMNEKNYEQQISVLKRLENEEKNRAVQAHLNAETDRKQLDLWVKQGKVIKDVNGNYIAKSDDVRKSVKDLNADIKAQGNAWYENSQAANEYAKNIKTTEENKKKQIEDFENTIKDMYTKEKDEYEKQIDAETKKFKDATDERIKQMEREHNKQKELNDLKDKDKAIAEKRQAIATLSMDNSDYGIAQRTSLQKDLDSLLEERNNTTSENEYQAQIDGLNDISDKYSKEQDAKKTKLDNMDFAKMSQDAIKTGKVVDLVTGQTKNLTQAYQEFEVKYGDGITVITDKVKEFNTQLQLAQTIMQNYSQVNKPVIDAVNKEDKASSNKTNTKPVNTPYTQTGAIEKYLQNKIEYDKLAKSTNPNDILQRNKLHQDNLALSNQYGLSNYADYNASRSQATLNLMKKLPTLTNSNIFSTPSILNGLRNILPDIGSGIIPSLSSSIKIPSLNNVNTTKNSTTNSFNIKVDVSGAKDSSVSTQIEKGVKDVFSQMMNGIKGMGKKLY